MTYLDYFKAEFKRSFFSYSVVLTMYLIVCLFHEPVRNNLVPTILVTGTTAFIVVLIKAFRSYKNKDSIKDLFEL